MKISNQKEVLVVANLTTLALNLIKKSGNISIVRENINLVPQNLNKY